MFHNFILKSPFALLFFFIYNFINPHAGLWYNNSQEPWNNHYNVLCFFIWCHFVYLECFWKKKKSKKKSRVNANMQLCLLYQSVWFLVGLEWYFYSLVAHKHRWGGIKNERGCPMMSKASWRATSQLSNFKNFHNLLLWFGPNNNNLKYAYIG